MSLPSLPADSAPHIVIVGGGITGLAAAHRLAELSRERERPLRITLLEAGQRLGGVIETERQEDFLLELGPDYLGFRGALCGAEGRRGALDTHALSRLVGVFQDWNASSPSQATAMAGAQVDACSLS